MSSESASTHGPAGSPADVLARVRDDRKAELDHQTRVLQGALEWAALHTVPEAEAEEIRVATWRGTPIPLAGPGAPLVEEFCVPELASALGLSRDAGRALLAQALELGHRLPRLWERVTQGDAVAWKARKVADLTLGLTAEAAAWVDAHVADFVQTLSLAAVERLVEEAIARFMPAEAEARRRQAADRRHVTIDTHQVSFDGTSRVEGELDLADALDLDAAITAGAKTLADLGSDLPLDARRAQAVGELARRQLAFGFDTTSTDGSSTHSADGSNPDTEDDDATADTASTGTGTGQPDRTPAPSGSTGSLPHPAFTKPGRQVTLYVHLHQSAITGTSPHGSGGEGVDIARLENRGPHLVTADTVRDWLGTEGTKVTVRPVIDLNDEVAVEAYEIPDRIREAVILRDKKCYYPYCTTPARNCDLDHVVAFDQGGQTCTSNLAPGCRRDHRLKTHGGWRVRVIRPGTYEWTSPLGYRYLVWPGGTIDLTPDPPRAKPDDTDDGDQPSQPDIPDDTDDTDDTGDTGGLRPTGTDPP